ncbi:MAG: hypothetical protein ABL958_01820 [Bdellovibrionia bacterium]
MKRVFAVLAQALICTALLALPIKGYAEEGAQPANGQGTAAGEMDPQFEEQLASEVANSPNFEPSSDMKHALHELPEVAEE